MRGEEEERRRKNGGSLRDGLGHIDLRWPTHHQRVVLTTTRPS